MTGRFSNINPEQCAHYAVFLRHLSLAQANGLFWTMFFCVLLLMVVSSIQHQKSTALAVSKDPEKALSSQALTARDRQHKRLRQRWLGITCICFLLGIGCAIIECFALFNIEYCDGEDLTQLYWGLWSVLTVGSLIAILGVMVQFWIVLSSIETPSWAVALGTPVLVFAAIGWVWRHFTRQIWYLCFGGNKDASEDNDGDGESDSDNCGVDRWLSRAPTAVASRCGSISSHAPVKSEGESSTKSRETLKRTSTF